MAATGDILYTELDLRGEGAWQGGLGGTITSLLRFDRASLRAAAGLGVFGAAAGVAAGVARFAGRAVVAAGADQAVFNRAVGNLKGTIPFDELNAFATGIEDVTSVGGDAVAALAGILGTFQITGESAKSAVMPILNATEALKDYGVTAEGLAGQVGKAVQGGNFAALRRSGIFVDEARFKVDRLGAVLEALQSQGGNAAEAFRGTLPGALMALEHQTGALYEAFGNLFGGGETGGSVIEPLIGVTRAATGAVNALAEMPTAVKAGLGIAVVGGAAVATAAVGKFAFSLAKASVENVKLTNEALKAGGAATTQAGAENTAAAAITGAGNAAGAATTQILALARAHDTAAAAALRHAAASRGVGGVPMPTGAPAPTRAPGGTATAPSTAPSTAPTRTPRGTTAPAPTTSPAAKPTPATAPTAVAPATGAAPAAKAAKAAATAATAAPAAKAATEAVAKAGLGARALGAAKAAGGKVGSPAAMAAMFVGGMALSAIPGESRGKSTAQGALGGAATGAWLGGMLGSFVPVLGNAVGAAAGAAIGGAIGGGRAYMAASPAPAAETAAKPAPVPAPAPESAVVAELQRANELMRRQLEELAGIRRDGKAPLDYSALSGSRQMEAIARAL